MLCGVFCAFGFRLLSAGACFFRLAHDTVLIGFLIVLSDAIWLINLKRFNWPLSKFKTRTVGSDFKKLRGYFNQKL